MKEIKPSDFLGRALLLGYSPKIITFILTAISFPLVVRELGASEFGVATIVGSIIGIIQLFGDGGISYAVGKAVAESRPMGNVHVRHTILVWVRAQICVTIPLFLLTLIASFIIFDLVYERSISFFIFLVAAISSTLSIYSCFIRTVLRSLFSFGKLSILDSFESVARSVGWLIVAFKFPTAFGFVFAGMISVLIGAVVAVVFLLTEIFSKPIGKKNSMASVDKYQSAITIAEVLSVLKESTSFMLIRIVTQGFYQFPILTAGILQGPENAAVVAALLKLVDIINGPIVVLGNIIGVKAVEIRRKGAEAVRFLWDAEWRLCATWFPLLAMYFVVSPEIASYMFQQENGMVMQTGVLMSFQVFSVFLIMHVIASVFAVQVDYLGRAVERLRLMMLIGVIEVLFIAIGAFWGGLLGVILAISASYIILVIGYVFLARLAFNVEHLNKIPADVFIFIMVTLIGLGCAVGIGHLFHLGMILTMAVKVVTILLFVFGAVSIIPLLKVKYCLRRLLMVEP
ncbi:MAG: lipopolysaccharide biosynthesis protein [Thermodesulfobacteriota bacterium]